MADWQKKTLLKLPEKITFLTDQNKPDKI